MQDIAIGLVTLRDVPLLEVALRQLAVDLGDEYAADQATLAEAVCGTGACCFALLATGGGEPLGALLASGLFSTKRGGAGLFISDLWVADPARRRGLARRLLAAALKEGERRKSALFLKLNVYHENPAARAAYERLGFIAHTDETNMVLAGNPLIKLKEI